MKAFYFLLTCNKIYRPTVQTQLEHTNFDLSSKCLKSLKAHTSKATLQPQIYETSYLRDSQLPVALTITRILIYQ